ncbi:MAG TPA: bifunctional phosphoribosylaminoimidazolecarboxamide formyltransferase/IMP cyclohydrolase, partial [Aquella sp.]|nr:bifunctional phosphoribosylaminoimidazolecarboxamide formyltransferase/IMP cyclohydrolase [Aquella sp.]
MTAAIKRALISVSDKTGILEFARALDKLGVEILSTGGTYEYLLKNDVPVLSVANITKFPEILDGRVKTLHPNIHGAILARRDDQNHIAQLEKHDITEIDLVCVNLYPFEKTVAKLDCTFHDAIENIDIGGPAMIRASSKNHQHVVIVTNPDDYSHIISELQQHKDISQKHRLQLAYSAFSHTAYYDSIISQYLGTQLSDVAKFSTEMTIPLHLVQTLRYGENSHQHAAFYRDSGEIGGLLASFKQLQGKELSYNNLADTDTAWECVKQFSDTACVIVKHANPCGVAIAGDSLNAYKKAFDSDPVSSFGGIIAFNKIVDASTAEAVSVQFVEVLVAPEYAPEALEILAKKPNVRVLEIKLTHDEHNRLDYKRIGGGILVQSIENKVLDKGQLKVATKIHPDDQIMSDLEFAWAVARFVKSNAIVLVKDRQTIGIGAGQMSRIDSSKLAISKAREYGFDPMGSVCASDAFFPFRDNVDLLASSGVKAIIQPGGS